MLKCQKCLFITTNQFHFKTQLAKRIMPPQLRQQSTATAANATSPSDSRNIASADALNIGWHEAKPYEDIPTLSLFTMLKNFLPGGKYAKLDTAQLMLAFRDDMGPICKLKGVFGKPDNVMTYNPDDIEITLRNEGIWPIRPGSEAIHYHRGVLRADFFQGVEGLVGTQGEQWGTFRSVVNPVLMQPKNVRLYFKKMSQVNKEFIDRIREIRDPITFEVPDNFEEDINRWTLESVSVVALDKQLGLITKNRDDPVAKRMFQALTEFFTYSVDIEFKPSVWKYYKTPTFQKLMKSLDDIIAITKNFVDQAIERMEEQQKRGEPERPDHEKSVLEKLVKIDKKIATVMAMDMLMAGVDTTSTTFTGLLLCLAKNPAKQAKLREEVRQLLPEKDSEFNETVFKNMPYLRACIKEALRIYPLAIGNARIPVNDIVLSGYRVPQGTQVSMVTFPLLQDETHYPRAKEFLPERWLRPSKDDATTGECPNALKTSNPFINLPFGFGSRSCIGRRIVEMEMELGIARMIRHFHVAYNYPTDKAFKSLLIYVPNIPLKFQFTDVKD